MAYDVGRADTDEDREAVYRFRYSVYVEEMGRYQDTADHEGKRLVDPTTSGAGATPTAARWGRPLPRTPASRCATPSCG